MNQTVEEQSAETYQLMETELNATSLHTAGPAEQVRQTRQLPDQSYRNPQLKTFHCYLYTLIVYINNNNTTYFLCKTIALL